MTRILTALLLLGPLPAPAPAGLAIEKLGDGVYAALQPAELRFDECNSAIVVLDDGVLVVDTQTSPAAARQVIDALRGLTSKPVRWVVNTHWHGDHVQGNQAYRDAFPAVEFVAHENTREDIEQRAGPAHAEELEQIPAWIERAEKALASGEGDGQQLTAEQLEALRGRLARRRAYLAKLREVNEFVLPTGTVHDTFTIRSGREVRLLHYLGHTRGDLVIYLPAEQVLITGDLLDDLPYTGHGSPAELVETLRDLDRLEFDTIVPGHGGVRHGREHLRRVTALFESLVEQTGAAARSGLSLEEAKQKVDVSAQRDYFVRDQAADRVWQFFIDQAIARAYGDSNHD